MASIEGIPEVFKPGPEKYLRTVRVGEEDGEDTGHTAVIACSKALRLEEFGTHTKRSS